VRTTVRNSYLLTSVCYSSHISCSGFGAEYLSLVPSFPTSSLYERRTSESRVSKERLKEQGLLNVAGMTGMRSLFGFFRHFKARSSICFTFDIIRTNTGIPFSYILNHVSSRKAENVELFNAAFTYFTLSSSLPEPKVFFPRCVLTYVHSWTYSYGP